MSLKYSEDRFLREKKKNFNFNFLFKDFVRLTIILAVLNASVNGNFPIML